VSKRNEHGVVLAMAAPHHDKTRAGRGEQVTVYWQGPATPHLWSTDQRDAVRYIDEAVARFALAGAVGQEAADACKAWVVPALHARNGGPTGPILDAAGAAVASAGGPAAPEPEQGDLFGAMQ
jgi:hypothetical protein